MKKPIGFACCTSFLKSFTLILLILGCISSGQSQDDKKKNSPKRAITTKSVSSHKNSVKNKQKKYSKYTGSDVNTKSY